MKKVVFIIFLLALFIPFYTSLATPDCNSDFCADDRQWAPGGCPSGQEGNEAVCKQLDKEVSGCCIKSGFVPCGNPGQPACNLCHVFVMVKNFFDILIDYAALIAALFIAVGGVAYILSGGNEERAKTAKKIITSAIYGLLIVFGAWLIINIILDIVGYSQANLGIRDPKDWWIVTGCP